MTHYVSGSLRKPSVTSVHLNNAIEDCHNFRKIPKKLQNFIFDNFKRVDFFQIELKDFSRPRA